MSQRQRENFYRQSILTVDHSRKALVSLINLHLSHKQVSFEGFLNHNQHKIYHFYKESQKCCQCKNQPAGNKLLLRPQLEHLFEIHGRKLTGHFPTSTYEFCCSKAKSGIKTDSLSVTLARFLLFNFCVDVFWYSCLTLSNLTFDDFIDKNKHALFHKLANSIACCKCQQGSVISEKPNPLFQFQCQQDSVISEKPNSLFQFQWNILFTFNPDVKCSGMQGQRYCICKQQAVEGIEQTARQDKTLERTILECACPIWKGVEKIVELRNATYNYANSGEIPDSRYISMKEEQQKIVVDIARVTKGESHVIQQLHYLQQQPFDESKYIKYKTILMNESLKTEDTKM